MPRPYNRTPADEGFPCGWPGCPSRLGARRSVKSHWTYCFGHGLPSLATGLNCKIANCKCGGVDFPSTERLVHHQATEVRLSNKQQCVTPPCGCRKFFADLSEHRNRVAAKMLGVSRSKAEEGKDDNAEQFEEIDEESSMVSIGLGLDNNNMAEGEHSNGSIPVVNGRIQAMEHPVNMPPTRIIYKTKKPADFTILDENEHQDNTIASFTSFSKKKRNSTAGAVTIKQEHPDQEDIDPATPPTKAAKRNVVIMDLTEDSDDEDLPNQMTSGRSSQKEGPKVVKKALVESAKVPLQESANNNQNANMISQLFEIIAAQNMQLQTQQTQIHSLVEAVTKRA